MKKSDAVVSSMSYDDANESAILLQTASALAIGRNGSMKVRCLMDGGSQRTFIHEKISRQLNLLVIGEELLTIHTFGEEKPSKVLRRRVRLTLQNPRDSRLSVDVEALESPTICSATIQVPGRRIEDYFLHHKLQLADSAKVEDSDFSITVLIGTDNYWKLVNGSMRRLTDSLVALETILGWTVHGPSSVSVFSAGQSSVSVMEVATAGCTNEEELDFHTWKNFWDLDSLGIVDNEQNVSERESDSKIMDNFRASIKFDKGRYVVRLPWKADVDKIEDNLEVAKGRFYGLSRKFRADPNLYFRYSEIIEDYLQKGIVEVVDPIKEGRSNEPEEKRIYYLPHRAVIREDKATTKLRVVFDASSHSPNAVSLNGCLESGPNLNPDLLQLLIRFRLFPVAFTADIEQAFLQISLAEEDRDVARFIWVDDLLHTNENEQNEKILRMTRVLFGVTSSPFLLAATIKTHLLKYVEQYPEACRLLNESLYVDDLIGGAQDVDQAFQRSCEIKSILRDAGMNMRKWETNSSELQKKWSESVEINFESGMKHLCEGAEIQKVLGLGWRNDLDALVFDTSSLLKFVAKGQNTKRGILQAVGRIFDPLGFLNPFTIKAKVLFQELWVRKIEWDTNLPDDLMERWTEWCLELTSVCKIAIPRSCVTARGSENAVQLHCFSDASTKAYGTVLYLRADLSNGVFGVGLLASKSRVAPLKTMTVPRLELMGALLSVRLAEHVLKIIRETHKVSCFFWTDSMIALHWIKGSARRWKQFVQNRVTEIQGKTELSSWSHCPGTCNPADLLTRGTSVRVLKDSALWWNGPEFLQWKRDQWPKEEIEESHLVEVEKECRADAKSVTQASCASESDGNVLLDIKRYSKLSKLLRVTAWVFRFINNSRNALQRIVQSLTTEELEAARMYWVKRSQMTHFSDEIQRLKAGKACKVTSSISVFRPFLDEENVLRLGGRLQESFLSYEQKHPIILSGEDEFSRLTIQDSHERTGHGGVSETVIQVRSQYWIVKGRQKIKSFIHKCNLCKKFRAKPVTQDTATLPRERIEEAPPFNVVGLDFAGPLYLRNEGKTEKGYIVLFTCAVTRAIHLELASDMTLESFMLAFRRFIGRRGICKVVYSDNAKTFKATARELEEIWSHLRHEDLQGFFGKNCITWKFIVERAAWWGGFWERLVRSVKGCLRKILGRACLRFDEMETTLVEIEAILNSRPLTFVYNTPNEPTALTPSHFLIGERLTSLPSTRNAEVETSSSKQELKRRYEYREKLLSQFWKRWREEYVLDLRSAHRLNSANSANSLKEGSVVLLHDIKLPRLMWKMAIVTKLHTGRDGKVRACEVRLSNGNIVARPVQLLCPLEL